jgi:hypothetical protein
MAKTKQADVVPGGIIERLRHPSPRARVLTFIAIWLLSSLYFTVSTVIHGRDLLPKSHDEHSYVIQTQMLARGRLWMPQHPLADFFESFQMLARPVYASIYFPGSALMYVPGVWLGMPPWVMPVIVSGLGVGLTYLLVARLTDGLWGLVAVLLVVACHWVRMNATLVMSQSPMMVLGLGILLGWLKWRETKHIRWAALIGACAGWAAIVRPVDALAFAIPVGFAMLLDFRGMPVRRIAETCGVVVLAALPFLSLQLALNKGTTGSFARAPHTLYLNTDQPDTTYGFHTYNPDARPQSKLLQKTVYYRGFMVPDVQSHQPERLLEIAWERLKLTFVVALPTPLLLIFVPFGLFALTDRPRRVVAAVPLVFFLLYLPYTFYMEHYVVPIIVPILLLIVLGAERIASIWKQPVLHRKAERTMVAALVLVALASLPELNPRVRDDRIFAPMGTLLRRAIAERVERPAAVLVRYHASENPHDEPVYNDSVAWPDDADVIVAHDLGFRDVELLEYYERTQPGRHYYLFDRKGPEGKPTMSREWSARELTRAIERAQAATTNSTQPSTP